MNRFPAAVRTVEHENGARSLMRVTASLNRHPADRLIDVTIRDPLLGQEYCRMTVPEARALSMMLQQVLGEIDGMQELMSVTLAEDGTVTSHNAYDADYDKMVQATQHIITELQRRLSDRKFCPYSHGGALRIGDIPVGNGK